MVPSDVLERAENSIRENFENSFQNVPPTREELEAERDALLGQNNVTRDQLYGLADSNLLSKEGYFLYSKVQNLDFVIESLYPDED